jgi:hypothetical protein
MLSPKAPTLDVAVVHTSPARRLCARPTRSCTHPGWRGRDRTATAMRRAGTSHGCDVTEGACPARTVRVAAQLYRIEPCADSAFEAFSSGCVRQRGEEVERPRAVLGHTTTSCGQSFGARRGMGAAEGAGL